MKKQYTKKQIKEAISYWQNKLNKMNEAIEWPSHTSGSDDSYDDPYANMTWGEVKAAIDKFIDDDDSGLCIQLVCAGKPCRDGFGETVCYVDNVDNYAGKKIITLSMGGC